MLMTEIFSRVHAFEPLAEHRECFVLNAPKAKLHPYALGEKQGTCSISTTQGQSGDSVINGDGDIEVRTLDSFHLSPDFIKIDCEGYEYFVLKGAEKTIRVNKPVIIVEQKPGKASKFGLGDTDAVKFLETLGYSVKKVIAGDYICTR